MHLDKLPLISVIVPVYNVVDYVERCLTSLCAQTYPNLQIIVVDDGSTDGSAERCDCFARKDARIRVIHQSNGGQSAARNRGLAEAEGELLGFVDGDDWVEPDMYESLYVWMQSAEADIAICAHYRNNGTKQSAKYSSGVSKLYTHDEAMQALLEDKKVRNYLWDKLYKRALFEGIEFPLGRIFEDMAVMYKVFDKAIRVVMYDSPKYHYLIREGSAMQSRYNPQKEHWLFSTVYQQVTFVQQSGRMDNASVYVLRRGIRLIDHLSMVEGTLMLKEIISDVLQKMHEHDAVDIRQLGLSMALKRYFIYHHFVAYQVVYRWIRSLFHSKRHKF